MIDFLLDIFNWSIDHPFLATFIVTVFVALYCCAWVQRRIRHQWLYTLSEDYAYEHSMLEGLTWTAPWAYIRNGKLTVKAGYSWDGATPKRQFLGLWTWGTPDGILRKGKPWLYYPTLVHDVACQYGLDKDIGFPLDAKASHQLFYYAMEEVEWELAPLYFRAVKWFGPKKFYLPQGK